MIAHIEGVVTYQTHGTIVLDVSGVGYKIHIGSKTSSILSKKEGESVFLFTHLAPRENALDLYGFLKREELEFFELLIAISGIGPKSALSILNVADVNTLQNAIHAGESTYLIKVSGIGKKNAEKIILELRDKLGSFENEKGSKTTKEEIDALEALQTLGYSAKDARESLRQVPKETTSTSDRIKEALKILGRS